MPTQGKLRSFHDVSIPERVDPVLEDLGKPPFLDTSTSSCQELLCSNVFLTASVHPHVESFDFFLEKGIKRAVKDLDPVEVCSFVGLFVAHQFALRDLPEFRFICLFCYCHIDLTFED